MDSGGQWTMVDNGQWWTSDNGRQWTMLDNGKWWTMENDIDEDEIGQFLTNTIFSLLTSYKEAKFETFAKKYFFQKVHIFRF